MDIKMLQKLHYLIHEGRIEDAEALIAKELAWRADRQLERIYDQVCEAFSFASETQRKRFINDITGSHKNINGFVYPTRVYREISEEIGPKGPWTLQQLQAIFRDEGVTDADLDTYKGSTIPLDSIRDELGI